MRCSTSYIVTYCYLVLVLCTVNSHLNILKNKISECTDLIYRGEGDRGDGEGSLGLLRSLGGGACGMLLLKTMIIQCDQTIIASHFLPESQYLKYLNDELNTAANTAHDEVNKL